MRETPRAAATDEARRAAVEQARSLMLGGASQNKAAADAGTTLGVSGRTVIRWAEACGSPLLSLSQDTTKKATETARAQKRTYDQARRLDMLDTLFDKALDIVAALADAREFKDAMTGVGILFDKRRLEEGLATDRVSIEQREAAEAETAALGELHARLRLARGSA